MKPTASFCLTVYTLASLTAWVSGYHQSENTTSVLAVLNYNPRPCMRSSNNNGYRYFRQKHILGSQFDTNNKQQWLRYLNSRGLCGRVAVQTFMQAEDEVAVRSICRGGGINLRQNLCISRRSLLVYAIWSQKPCKKPCIVRSIRRLRHPVVVACDAKANQCLPVHYERYRGQKPDNNAPICR